jgi:hypothetical protein
VAWAFFFVELCRLLLTCAYLRAQGGAYRKQESAVTNIEAFIAAHKSKPMTHRVATLYDDGTTKFHETRSLAAAQTWAEGQQRKVGRCLIDCEAGKTVRVLAVIIDAI